MHLQYGSGEHVLCDPIMNNGENLIVEGIAPNETSLLFDDCMGIDCTLGPAQQAVIRNLTLKTNAISKHTAIKLVCDDGSHYLGTGPIFENVCLTGSAPSHNNWRWGIDITNGWWSKLNNVVVYGRTTDYKQTQYGIILRGNSIGVKMSQVEAFFLRTGIIVLDACEGLTLSQCDMVSVETGVYWTTPAPEPKLSIHDCHFDVSLFGAYLINCQQTNITNNLIYLNTSEYMPAAIWINYLSNHVFIDNQIEVLSPKTKQTYGFIGSGISNYSVKDNKIQGVDYPTWIQ